MGRQDNPRTFLCHDYFNNHSIKYAYYASQRTVVFIFYCNKKIALKL